MFQDAEQINPFDKSDPDYWIKIEHLGRYLFVKDFLLSHRKIEVVMDIAAGYGYGTDILSKLSQKVIALENNPEMLKHLDKRFQTVQTVDVHRHDLEKENLLRKKYVHQADLIVSFETLEHLANPRKNILEFHNLLALKGYLILSVPNEKFEAVDAKGIPKSDYHKVILNKRDIERYLGEAGFQIIGRYGQSQLNRLMKRENNLYRKRKIRSRFSHINELHQQDNMINGAYLLAYPTDQNIEESYSRIYVARKVEK